MSSLTLSQANSSRNRARGGNVVILLIVDEQTKNQGNTHRVSNLRTIEFLANRGFF